MHFSHSLSSSLSLPPSLSSLSPAPSLSLSVLAPSSLSSHSPTPSSLTLSSLPPSPSPLSLSTSHSLNPPTPVAACLVRLPPLSLLPRIAIEARKGANLRMETSPQRRERRGGGEESGDVRDCVCEMWVAFSDVTVRIFDAPSLRPLTSLDLIPPALRANLTRPLNIVGMFSFSDRMKRVRQRVVAITSILGFYVLNGLSWSHMGEVAPANAESAVTTYTHIPHRNQFWTGDSSCVAHIWTYGSDGVTRGKSMQMSHEITCMTSTADSVLLGGGGVVTVIDLQSEAALKYFWVAHPHGNIVSLQSLYDDGRVVSVDRNREMKIWDASTYDLLDQFELFEKSGEVTSSVVYPGKSADGMIVGYKNGEVVTYDPAGRSRVQTLTNAKRHAGPQILLVDIDSFPLPGESESSGCVYVLGGGMCELWDVERKGR